jgi:antitoxin VapB
MLVLCFRYEGLVAAVTRLVHFGPLSEGLRAKMAAVARVDARRIVGTQPGHTLAEMFALARQAYAEEGYPEAINEHHQGGSIAYASREELATPGNATPIAAHQAFAWNPSIRGVKSEDTILLDGSGPQVLTTTTDWPVCEVTCDGRTLTQPAILER